MKKEANLKNVLPNIILIVFFIIGLSIFLYPFISNYINQKIQNKEISKYEISVSELSLDKYEKLLLEAQEYNKTLVGNNLATNNENIKNTNYKNLLSLDSTGIMGYLYISKIDVKLPIYHGTDDSTLQVGLGHFEGSSLPVEGQSTHSIIVGHTGLSSAKLLTDLIKMEIGDSFEIAVLNKKYTYEVDQILIVKPDETEALEIVPNAQYATIITCTPYRVNSHRLLVRGVLKENKSSLSDVSSDAVIINSNIIIFIASIILIILIIISSITTILVRKHFT